MFLKRIFSILFCCGFSINCMASSDGDVGLDDALETHPATGFQWERLPSELRVLIFKECTPGAKLGLTVSGSSTWKDFGQDKLLQFYLNLTNKMFVDLKNFVIFGSAEVTVNDAHALIDRSAYGGTAKSVNIDKTIYEEQISYVRRWFQQVVLSADPDIESLRGQQCLAALHRLVNSRHSSLKSDYCDDTYDDKEIMVDPTRLYDLTVALSTYPPEVLKYIEQWRTTQKSLFEIESFILAEKLEELAVLIESSASRYPLLFRSFADYCYLCLVKHNGVQSLRKEGKAPTFLKLVQKVPVNFARIDRRGYDLMMMLRRHVGGYKEEILAIVRELDYRTRL